MIYTITPFTGTVTWRSVDCSCLVRYGLVALIKQRFKSFWVGGSDQPQKDQCVVSRPTNTEIYINKFSTDQREFPSVKENGAVFNLTINELVVVKGYIFGKSLLFKLHCFLPSDSILAHVSYIVYFPQHFHGVLISFISYSSNMKSIYRTSIWAFSTQLIKGHQNE